MRYIFHFTKFCANDLIACLKIKGNPGSWTWSRALLEEREHSGLCDCAADGFYPEVSRHKFHVYF